MPTAEPTPGIYVNAGVTAPFKEIEEPWQAAARAQRQREDVCDETIKGDKENGYRGCQSRTINGRKCQKWTSMVPHTR